MTIELRPATADDLAAVGALHHRSRVAAYRDIVPADALAAISAEMMGAYWTERWPYERDSHLMTLAERDGVLAGFSYLGPDDLGDPVVGLLNAIHVEPHEQGRGVGRTLMVHALATMYGRGWRRAALWVLAGNAHARRFYERAGWLADGSERDDHVGPAPVRQVRYTRPLP